MDYTVASFATKLHGVPPEADPNILPAHFAVQTITAEIFAWLEKKLDLIANESIEKQLNKSIRRGDDSYFGNLLRALSCVCETCLPSVLKVMTMWYEHQQRVSITEIGDARNRAIKRTLAASYLFCIVLVEILPQLHFHPSGCDEQINFIINNSFKQISYRDPALFGNNYDNSLLVAELFAEVIGILSQSHSKQIQRTFFEHLNEYRKDTLVSSVTLRSIISLLMGMKFFRVQTNQVSEFEMGVSFLNELGSYFLEVDLKQKDLKHALAGLLVEILLPMAAQIKTETNIPALISFVDKLYGPTYELVNKKQHKMAAYPLLTCLLCISQSKFFLFTWVQFLNLTLANLKNKDSMVSRMALESLYRLIWVYIIRISCEGNTATRSRLESICGSLFPRGSRNLVPRDAPLNIFVKIIHFIAQFKVDFAFKEIIFDLIGCARASRQLAIYPERMNVGLRALMVIADGLQQKESPPGMPRSLAPNASGTILRTKRNYLTKPLSMDVARSIGLEQYYPHCRKAFDAILRTLDGQIGRPLMLTSPQMRGKEYNDIIGADMKAKLDLFRTCIAAIPRLLPDPMSHQDLIDFLTRMCIHVDEELRSTAYQSLQNLITECPEWREDIIHNFIRFFISSVQDTFPALIESMVRLLLQLLTVWKANIILEQQRRKLEECSGTQIQTNNVREEHCSSSASGSIAVTAQITNSSSAVIAEKSSPGQQKLVMQAAANIIATSSSSAGNTTSSCSEGSPQMIRSFISSLSFAENINPTFVLHCVEGLCIALLCQLRLQTKKAVIQLLREVKQLMELFKTTNNEPALIDILDYATPYVLDKYVLHISATEKNKWPKDFASVCERISMLETDANLVNVDNGNEYMQWDAWACALSGYCEKKFLPTQCSTASTFAWPILFLRFSHCNQFVDPSNPQNESRSSLLRSSKSKSSNFTLCGEMLSQENYLSLWQKYLVVTFALCHCNSNSNLLPNSLNQFRSMSPCFTMDSTEVNRSMISSVKVTRAASTNFVHLMQKAVTIIRWEATDVRDSVVLGIGSVNPECFEFLLEEFISKGILREINERKNENNVRRRRRKDLLRLQILRIIEFTLFRDFFKHGAMLERNSGTLPQSMLELFDSFRFHTENDSDRDLDVLTSLRLHFAKLISLIIANTPIEQREKLLPPDTKRSLFFLFLSWCGRTIGTTIDKRKGVDVGISVEQQAIRAMCALATVGPVFECANKICDEDAMFRWLETLLSSTNPIVDEICESTLCLMLHLNEHHPRLLERLVQMCYTKNDLVGIRCFRAISMLFSQREFPCEYISLLCLCQSFASAIELASVRQTAFLLIQLLRHQFLNSTFSPTSLTPIMEISNNSSKNGQPLEISFPTNQLAISKHLSSQYPQLTMPIFSEICCRLESARPNRQLSLLTILPEWLRNVHLVDPNCDIVTAQPNVVEMTADDAAESTNEDEQNVALNGWGSEESTQLILNNLLYLTAKLANECNSEVYNIWHCLATSWPSNLGIIVHYLFVTLTLSLDNLLPLAKRICVYLLDATGDRLVSMLMAQLQRVGDPFMAQLCRSEIPPFFRWQPKFLVPQDGTYEVTEENVEKRITTTNCYENNSKDAQVSVDILTHSSPPSGGNQSQPQLQQQQNRSRLPNQLPMPPYGGNYCRLSALLPPTSQNVSALPRNNLALFLLCDLLLVGPTGTSAAVAWPAYHPKLLHMATINLDAHRPIVVAHARQILLNICLYFSNSGSCSINQVASAILKHCCHSTNCNSSSNGGPNIASEHQMHQNSMVVNNNGMTTTPTKWHSANANDRNIDGGGGEIHHIFSNMPVVFASKKEVLTALVQLFSSDQQTPLWEHEEVSQLCWKPNSVNQLECLVRLLVAYLHSSVPDLVLNWTNFAIDFAISSNNLHLAGRSFQTASALGLSPSPFLHRILSRLTEMVGDLSEESQSYITDLFMCLQSLAQNIAAVAHPSNASQFLQSSPMLSGHNRSVSYTQQIPTNSPSRKVSQKKGSDMRHSLLIGAELLFPVKSDVKQPLVRSQSAATLKLPEDSANILLTEKDTELISQLLFMALAMTESNLDNEFLLGLSFVDKLLLISGKERVNCLSKLDELVIQHGWDDFPGIVALCLKGSFYTSGSDWAISVFCNCMPHLCEQVVVSKQPNDAFALMVIASLPQFVFNFDAPTQLCARLAQKIISYCQNRIANDALDVSSGDHPICNLITIMNQFRDRSFPRERTQWTKCVVNYLIDALGPDPLQMLLFLAEMLDKCSASFHSVLLDVMHLLFAYGNYNDSSPALINSQVIRVILKHIHGPNGREVSKILKIVTDQWNSISYNCLTEHEKSSTALRKPEFELHFARPLAKETAEIGGPFYERALKNKVRHRLITVLSASGHRARSPKHSSMLFSHSSSDIHQKVRDAIALTARASTIGQNGAILPSSDSGDAAHPSTWSQQQQPTDDLIGPGGVGFDRMSSPNSLMSAVVGANNNSGANSGGELASLRTTDSFPRVFKEFDFLEAEHDSVSESTDSCFNWLSTMRTARCGVVSREEADAPNGGTNSQDHDEDVPDEDDYYNDEEEDEMDQSVFATNRMCIGNFGSPRTVTSSRHSMGSSNNSNSCGAAATAGAGDRKSAIAATGVTANKRRPQSRMSDSNDVSSDTTPVQSSRHSDDEEEEEEDADEAESVSSCALSEDDENESIAPQAVGDNLLPASSHKGNPRRRTAAAAAEDNRTERSSAAAEPISSPTNMTMTATTLVPPLPTRSSSTATSSTHRHKQRSSNNNQRHKRHKRTSSSPPPPVAVQPIILSHHHHQRMMSSTSSACAAVDSSVVSPAASSSQPCFLHHLSERNNEETSCSSCVINFRTISLSTPERMMNTAEMGAADCASSLCQQRQQQRHEPVEGTAVSDGSDLTVTPLECSHHISGLAEHTWNTLVASLGNDHDGNVTSSLMLLFTQLLRESVVHLSSIFRDASHLLSTETSLLQMPSKGGISIQLSHSLNVVLRLADCPFLFVTPLFLRSSNLLTSQKFALFEIREHFDTYAERRSQAIRALNSVKSSLKLMIISNNGGGGSAVAAVEGNRTNSAVHNQQFDYCSQQTVLLCKSLHRLSFQLLLMLEKLLEMVQFVLHSADSQDFDMTPAVISLQRDLLTHQAASALDDLCCSASGSSTLSHQSHRSDESGTFRSLGSICGGLGGAGGTDIRQSRDTLVLHITNKQFKSAFSKLAFLRSHYCNGTASGQFGCCEQTNVDVLLLHFCRSHLSLRMWALVGSLEMLRCWCTQLKEANIQLGILVRNLMLGGGQQQQSSTEVVRQQPLHQQSTTTTTTSMTEPSMDDEAEALAGHAPGVTKCRTINSNNNN